MNNLMKYNRFFFFSFHQKYLAIIKDDTKQMNFEHIIDILKTFLTSAFPLFMHEIIFVF